MTDIREITPIKLRGRFFTEHDLVTIESCVQEYYDQGRTYISRIICERLNWRQPNGWLKDRACRDVMLRLEEMGIINLPPSLIKRNLQEKNKREVTTHSLLEEYDLNTPITLFPKQIEFVLAKGNADEKIWNNLVANYHYLGHSVLVGRYIKYLIRSGEKLLGAISFSSPAWHLHSRNTVLSTLGISKPLEYTINNPRFLVLPNVQIRNLASHLLSLATKKIVRDWTWYYSVTPLVAETFVQPSLYFGTCYKAANWVEIGETKGYAKRGASYSNSQEPKKIFLYGLNKEIRRQLYDLCVRG